MSDQEEFPMTPLDQMLSSESLQIIKAAVPYAPPPMQKLLSVYAKVQELKTALTLFPAGESLQAMSAETARVSPAEMLSDISRFAVGSVRESMENLSSALTAAELFQTMQAEGSDAGWADTPENIPGEEGE